MIFFATQQINLRFAHKKSDKMLDEFSIIPTLTVCQAIMVKNLVIHSNQCRISGSQCTNSTLSFNQRKQFVIVNPSNTDSETNNTPHSLMTQSEVQTLTEQITQTVTASVIAILQQTGIIPANNVENQKLDKDTAGSSHGNGTPSETLGSVQSERESDSTSAPCSDTNPQNNSNKFVSSRIPLHATVSDKKKEKIWSGEFIELSTLQDDDVEDLTFNVRTGAVSTSSTQRKTFMSIEQWTDAFNIFSSVYRIKYPAEAEGLSSYMSLIRQIAGKMEIGIITIPISAA